MNKTQKKFIRFSKKIKENSLLFFVMAIPKKKEKSTSIFDASTKYAPMILFITSIML